MDSQLFLLWQRLGVSSSCYFLSLNIDLRVQSFTVMYPTENIHVDRHRYPDMHTCSLSEGRGQIWKGNESEMIFCWQTAQSDSESRDSNQVLVRTDQLWAASVAPVCLYLVTFYFFPYTNSIIM